MGHRLEVVIIMGGGPSQPVQDREGSPMRDDVSGPFLELLYVASCPNHEAFLPHLRSLLLDAGVDAPIELVEVTSDEEAQRLRFLGSPTLRINGVDVDPSAAGRTEYGLQCRLYPGETGVRGTPCDHWIQRALEHADPVRPR